LAVQVEAVPDENILGVEITAPVREGGGTNGMTDLSAIDFEKLAEAFVAAPKTTVEQLRAKSSAAVQQMAAPIPSRVDLIEKLKKLIDAHNAATAGTMETFEKLKAFLKSLDEEQSRAAREGLSEDEQAIYELAAWCREAGALAKPRKADQDMLDAALCALIALRWRLRPRANSLLLGDLTSGYMVTPASRAVRERLTVAAVKCSVPVDGVS